MPLEASPNTNDDDDNDNDDDDDDDEGMEVRLGFSLEAGLWSAPASAGPFGGVVLYAQGPAASLSKLWASAKPAPTPTTVEDAGVVEERPTSLPWGAIVEPTEV
jgi:hypothetical protein